MWFFYSRCGPGKMDGVDEHNQYCPVPDRKSGEQVMAGPVYHGVSSSNQVWH